MYAQWYLLHKIVDTEKVLSAGRGSQSVSDTGTNHPYLCLTLEFEWDPVSSQKAGRQRDSIDVLVSYPEQWIVYRGRRGLSLHGK